MVNMPSSLSEKFRKYSTWELFWKMITATLISILIIIYSLINLINIKVSVLSVLGLIIGLTLFIYGVLAIKRHYKKM